LSGGSVVIEVRDNGVGVPPQVDLRNRKSLGLQIVGILTRQLKGTVEMKRGNESGSSFIIRFSERSL
jgi:two-component sensor histidine kinase